MNVLWWIRGRSRQFKPFVASRVGEIQSSTDPEQWRYVPTEINPADLLSRGLRAIDLEVGERWWRGPAFLQRSEEAWPLNKLTDKPTGNEELKRSTALQKRFISQAAEYIAYANHNEIAGTVFVSTIGTGEAFPLDPSRYSSWLRLKRILAWIFRFIHNCQRTKGERTRGGLSSDEIKSAEIQLIKQEQRTQFKEEWTALSRGQSLPASSKLIGLQPKLDEDGLMRSDGRLKYADFLSFDVFFPIILPRKSWLTKLIVKNYHEKGNHASCTNHTLAALSARFWIISGREVIRQWEKDCMECRRRKAKAARQIMAPLPLSRLMTSTRAFTRTAVDFGGPYITVQGR